MDITLLSEQQAKKLTKRGLQLRIEAIALMHKENNTQPYKQGRNVCDTCKSKDGYEDNMTGYCFHCLTDNWGTSFDQRDHLDL